MDQAMADKIQRHDNPKDIRDRTNLPKRDGGSFRGLSGGVLALDGGDEAQGVLEKRELERLELRVCRRIHLGLHNRLHKRRRAQMAESLARAV